jgi:uncharacterized membrane protein required for colicin V production
MQSNQPLIMANLPFNLFDILLVTVLVWGVVQGRKHGISLELVGMLKWLCLVLICAGLYGPVGTLISGAGSFDLLSCYVLAYLGIALLMFLFSSMLERRVGKRLVGSDIFGRGEYFLGMGSGMLRMASMLLVGLALLNAREFNPIELRNLERYQEENYGSNIFPGLHSLQVAVFEKSFTGPLIRRALGFLLITPTGADEKAPSMQAKAH